LPAPFFLLATENPIELAGTFPLPEAQLDRFLFKLSLGYAARDAEVALLTVNSRREAIYDLTPVIDPDGVMAMITWAAEVTVSDAIKYYIVDLCQETRTEAALLVGASSRASQALMRAARVLAAAQG